MSIVHDCGNEEIQKGMLTFIISSQWECEKFWIWKFRDMTSKFAGLVDCKENSCTMIPDGIDQLLT